VSGAKVMRVSPVRIVRLAIGSCAAQSAGINKRIKIPSGTEPVDNPADLLTPEFTPRCMCIPA
jgi:hypothetical protein